MASNSDQRIPESLSSLPPPPPPPSSSSSPNPLHKADDTAVDAASMSSSQRRSHRSSSVKPRLTSSAPLSPPPPFPMGPPSVMMLSANNATFHPDFMFCGACAECHEADTAAGSTTVDDDENENVKTMNGNGKKMKDSALEDDDDEDVNHILLSHSNHQDDNDSDNDDDDDNDNNENNGLTFSGGRAIQTTTLQLRQPLTNASQSLVVQSLLRPVPGVHKVTLSKDQTRHYRSIHIDHDASVNMESINQALQSSGHPVLLQKNNNNTSADATTHRDGDHDETHTWVRSAFYVQGICCASEIPAVRKIVKPLSGVAKLNINLTTKVVHVQHDSSFIQATDIATALSTQGFPTQIQKDGAHMAQAKQQALSNDSVKNGRTTLHVQGIIQQRDVETIRDTLGELDGVTNIGVNVDEGVIYVDHDISQVSSDRCADHLTQRSSQFSCSVAIAAERAAGDAAAAALDSIGRSRYVESTFQFEGLQPYHIPVIENAIARNFIRAQVRAVYGNVPSETVKVEHDPKVVSADDICRMFQSLEGRSDIPQAKLNLDGANANLYLPLQEDYPGNQVNRGEEPSLMKIHANVWLSGIFWILSILSFIDGKEWFEFFGLASVLFGLPPIAIKAWRTLRRFQFDANCMMVTAAIGALALGEYDEAASVAFLFAISEFLEARATLKARKALAEICALRPDHANVIHPITKDIVVVPADRVPLGSLVSVRTGDKVAADGVVVEGSSAIDESSLTGESRPVTKRVGDAVSGGTINIGQTQLVVKTTTTVEDSAVSRLIRLVEEAQSNRSPTEKMIDAFARSYTPSVMIMALLMCTVPWAFGVEIGRHWALNGLIIIVIACPCALTISTPVTYAAGLAATAQRGIIIKGGSKLEAMGSVDRVVFDKTGTLTKGSFDVTHLEVTKETKSREEMLELLALVQQRSSHPLSSSLVQAAKDEGVQVPRHLTVTDHRLLKGEGISACVNGQIQVYIGNERLFSRLGMFGRLSSDSKNLISEWASTGGTVGFVGTQEDGIIGMFCVKDEVREEAKAVVAELKASGIETLICTGDSDAAAEAVAKEIGIPSSCVNSQLLPEDKLHLVGSLKRPQPKNCRLCRRRGYVLFLGDGVNDAPALAVADIGVSMGEGAAMALELSDVTLMDSRLDKLTYSIKMGRRVLRTVKENIAISLFAKLAVVALTFAGKMTLLYAIASDVGIMLVVTLNGMKLLPSSNLFEITRLDRRKRRAASENFSLIGSRIESLDSSDGDLATSEIV